MKKRRFLYVIGLVLIGPVLVFLGVAFFAAQRADYGWAPAVAQPTFVDTHPLVLFDEGHNNASRAGITGRYWPFGRLLRADGYRFERRFGRITANYLEPASVLVIANAAGAPKHQVFGINLPTGSAGKRGDPAFTSAEIGQIVAGVRGGGSLLLIADHAPFGEAVSPLAEKLGVTMHKGFAEVPGESSDPLLFSTQNGRLGDHAITRGTPSGRAITRVMTFTGQSLDGPPGATVLLRLPTTAWEETPVGDDLVKRPAGQAQGLAFAFGQGRVVVLGEAAMATAQVSARVPFGMNSSGNDNRQFVLNVMQWLATRAAPGSLGDH